MSTEYPPASGAAPGGYRFCPRCAAPLAPREEAGRMRAACTACDFVFYDNPTPVVAALVTRRGQVVLVRQKGWPEKFFALVAGFLERGESPEEGVLREVKEELGVDARVIELIGAYPFPLKNEVIVAYHVETEGEFTLGEELEAVKELPPEKLRPWALGTGLAVADWIARRVR